MNRINLVLLLFSFLSLFACKSDEAGKHLFILSGQSNMVGLDHNKFFTPWIEEAFGKENVLVVKYAKGSQPIQRWYKKWKSPLEESPELPGDLYDTLMAKVYDHIQDQGIKTVTFVWMQGERDARMGWGEVYGESLLGLYHQLSEDLNRAEVNFVIGRLSDFDLENQKYPHWTRVREAHEEVGESDPRFAWVNTDDLNEGLNPQGKEVKNDLHLSVKGYEVLGKRFAEKAVALINHK